MRGLLIIIGLAILLVGCTTTKYVPVEMVRTEYKDNIKEVHTIDSVVDTRVVYIKGDTVIDWRDRIKWKEKEIHDSIYIEKVDSIPVPYPVEKQLTYWEQVKIDFGGIAMGAVLIIAWIFVNRAIGRLKR